MKKLNETSIKIFLKLLQKLNGKTDLKIIREGFMPLVLEKLEINIITPFGNGITYSLSHNYVQNGDLMRDPEMVFIVIDNRRNETDYKDITILPQMYQQD